MASEMDQVYDDTHRGGNYSFADESDQDCLMMENDESVPMQVYIQHWTALILFPILLLQGIVGNLLSLPVLKSISKSSWSTVTYLIIVAATDLIILLVHCGDDWYVSITQVRLSERLINFSDAVCRTYSFLFAFTTHLNPWLYVAISVETLIATRWPKETYAMCTVERAKYVMMLITILLVCLDINHFWTMGIPKPGYGCRYTEEFSESFRDWIWPALGNVVEHGLPLVFVSVCFSLTACTLLRRSSEEQKRMEDDMKKYILELSTLKDFRSICLVVCFVFMCLAATKVSFSIIDLLVNRSYIQLNCRSQIQYDKVRAVMTTVKKSLTYIFYCTKIYLYLSFSGTFRSKVKNTFLSVIWKLRKLAKSKSCCGQQWTPIALNENRDSESGLHLGRLSQATDSAEGSDPATKNLRENPNSSRTRDQHQDQLTSQSLSSDASTIPRASPSYEDVVNFNGSKSISTQDNAKL
ncbi:CX3C chemokine receptor 1 isoform X2 [Biomphalaria glabrata]|nr:CX3C chemokine receptor 1 isoform X2 [Biomphalaria glabrata]